MSLPYLVEGQYTGSVYSGSYFNEQDNNLFYTTQSNDIWYGVSNRDVIEFGVYSVSDFSLVAWKTLYDKKAYNSVTLSYIDDLNNLHQYSYNELINEFLLYNHESILLKTADDLLVSGVTNGTHEVSYNFIRQMAGNPNAPLTIKEISPSRTEVKLIPQGKLSSDYLAFCVKKFPILDVAPVILSITKNCPYSQIYNIMAQMPSYQEGINFLKFAFFLTDDGSVIQFLRNIYEDYVKYTFLSDEQITSGLEPTQIFRIQGIKSYFNNYLLENYESITDFDALQAKFSEYTNLRLDKRFSQFAESQEVGYKEARQFCYDFFFQYFYTAETTPLKTSYNNKYFGYLKNVLNFGNNRYYPILNHGYIDEREKDTDPPTLIVKLSSALPTDISPKTNCWISNMGMVPFFFTTVLLNPVKYKTIKISPPNFGSPSGFISKENVNTLYSSDDLAIADESSENHITVNKSIAELNTDYSDYSNFIVFSSAQTRLNLFKTKIQSLTILSASLVELNRRYRNSLSSSVVYPYYTTESDRITGEINDIFNSFDGFESYLYNSGMYEYSIESGSFINSAYVEEEDLRAQEYDRNNADSLVANTPNYIKIDENNSDYLTFLQMIGHHFDNIYTYISALPIERQLRNEVSSSIPTKTLKEMLYSFGWNVDDIIGSLNIDEVYLNSMDSSSYDAMSAEQRLRTIWNRILVSLPGIYKTKGTEECVNYLMACYGLPTSMISIREYGGTDYADDTQPTYKLDEKLYMLNFSGSTYIEGPIPHTAKTIEFKFSTDPVTYTEYAYTPLFSVTPWPYTGIENACWDVGISKVPGQYMGKVMLRFLGGNHTIITSSALPIFNGDIFTVMVRRHEPNPKFEYTPQEDPVPVLYDLVVQRNENGRKIFYETSSRYLYQPDNEIFSQFGRFTLGSRTFYGNLDKLSIWDIPLDNADFEEHVNDLNSYGYSASVPWKNLWVRLSWDYPQSMYYNLSGSSVVWVDNRSPFYAIPNYYSDPKNLSSSLNPTLYSASLEIYQNSWAKFGYYPSGSIEIRAYNFPPITKNQWSASWNGCNYYSTSVYPYNFIEYTYQQELDASKYGPNRYKNKKIRDITYNVNARFDPYDRSTSEPSTTISGESNQLGFFVDPQDSKNKDIIRYVGKTGIMELIADPALLYSEKYPLLVNKNVEYNSKGNKRTYFNELLTIYKFYFDKSIFQTIKNVLPARANAYTGVVIEPTVLERPKYQNRPITSSLTISYEKPATLDDLYGFNQEMLWANFNTDWASLDLASQASLAATMPPNYQDTLDLGYVTLPTQIMPTNLDGMIGGYVTDFMDKIQFGYYPDFEELPRMWESTGAPPGWPIDPIWGTVTRDRQNDLLVIGDDQNELLRTSDPTSAGYNSGSHPILYYMVKVWDKYKYYAKTGEYVRTETPNDNEYNSASVYLYKYAIVSEPWLRRYVYWYNMQPQLAGNSDPSYTYLSGQYLHKVNTFKGTPDQITNNISASHTGSIVKTDFKIALAPGNRYFELSKGYPRNHYTHKIQKFSPTKYGTWSGEVYVKGRQTINTTVNASGIDDGTYPVQTFGTSNINVVNSSNIIQTVPSATTGQITPSSPTTMPNIEATPSSVSSVPCVPLKSQTYKNPSKNTKQVYNLTIGTKIGTVKITWDTKGRKDRFVMNWNGKDVIDSGCVKNKGSATFYKSLAYPTTATLTIISCEGASSGTIQVDCPI